MNINFMKFSSQNYLTTKSAFLITIIVIILTILGVWLFGVGHHQTVYENSILSTTILSISFFLFITSGLYKGVKLKDDLGKITDRIKINDLPDVSGGLELPAEIPDAGEGIGAIIIGIIVWLLFSILLLIFIWTFGVILWAMILVFAAMLYWIFYRALKLVFKNSKKCKGNILLSAGYGFMYSVLYNFWIYGILLISHYLAK
jgi:hypothetical protein